MERLILPKSFQECSWYPCMSKTFLYVTQVECDRMLLQMARVLNYSFPLSRFQKSWNSVTPQSCWKWKCQFWILMPKSHVWKVRGRMILFHVQLGGPTVGLLEPCVFQGLVIKFSTLFCASLSQESLAVGPRVHWAATLRLRALFQCHHCCSDTRAQKHLTVVD